MKIVLLLALVTVTYARNVIPSESYEWPCYIKPKVSYIQSYAIPLAEKIRNAEEQIRHGRIVGGSPSNLGDFPYQVGILAEYHNLTGIGVCGGALLNSNRVIAAAHCWHDGWFEASRFTLVLGSVYLFSGGTRIESSTAFMHPDYCAEPVRNDVAVVYLPVNVAFSDIISPIALPTENELDMDFAGVTAVVSGYGYTRDGLCSVFQYFGAVASTVITVGIIFSISSRHDRDTITATQSLKHVTLTVITNEECHLTYYPWMLSSTNICTSGAGGVNPCRGDSGGPLVYTSNNRRILIGTVSYGSGFGCQAGSPAVYARITSYMSFLNQHNIEQI